MYEKHKIVNWCPHARSTQKEWKILRRRNNNLNWTKVFVEWTYLWSFYFLWFFFLVFFLIFQVPFFSVATFTSFIRHFVVAIVILCNVYVLFDDWRWKIVRAYNFSISPSHMWIDLLLLFHVTFFVSFHSFFRRITCLHHALE